MISCLPSLADLRRTEAEALAAGLPLMERAGAAAARLALHLVDGPAVVTKTGSRRC